MMLWSQMIEDPGAPPYFSWLLALRACLQQYDDQALLADLGSGAAVIADIVPELRDRLKLALSPAPSNTSAARFLLFDAVTRFLLNVAQRKPLIILFDNLHLADPSSLALLEYFCQQIVSHPILVVGAYRESELNHQHPLRPVLNGLSRSTGFIQLVLSGLSRIEVAELLHVHLGKPPPAPLVDSVREQSDGNPLFVAEVGSMLARRIRDEQLPGAGFHFETPESLRAVIEARLNTLPTKVCDLLGIAAIAGREFDIGFLAELTKSNAGSLAQSLQSAETAGIISSLGQDKFRFHHVLYREVLYAKHSTASRIALHRKAGEQLEASYPNELKAHISQLAYHHFEAAQAGKEKKAVIYCRQAAETAITKRAYVEAVSLFDCALQAAQLKIPPDLECRFDLLLVMGQTQYQAGELNTATQTLMKSAELAFQQHWWEHLARALFAFEHVCQQSGVHHWASVPMHTAALDHIPEQSLALRARVLASLAKAYRTAAEPDLATSTFQQSISLARKCGDTKVLLDCLSKGNWTVGRSPSTIREGLEISRETLALAKLHGPSDVIVDAITDIVFQLCDLGEIEEIERQLTVLRELVMEQGQPHFLNVLVGFETALAILQGRWLEAIRFAKQAVSQVPLQGVLGLEGRFAFQIFAIQKATGSLQSVAKSAEQIISEADGPKLWLPGQILLHCELNQRQQARNALERLGDLRNLPADDLRTIALAYLAESCVNLCDVARCTVLYELLLPYRGLNTTLAGTLMLGAWSGYLAILAVEMRRFDEAKLLFEEAIAMNTKMDAKPALVRNYVDYGRLILRSDRREDRLRSQQLLGRAQQIATALELRPILNTIDELQLSAGADKLTQRELGVLRLIATGYSNRKIAESLHISHSTVATHIRHIFKKTGVTNRTEAVNYARSADLLGQN